MTWLEKLRSWIERPRPMTFPLNVGRGDSVDGVMFDKGMHFEDRAELAAFLKRFPLTYLHPNAPAGFRKETK